MWDSDIYRDYYIRKTKQLKLKFELEQHSYIFKFRKGTLVKSYIPRVNILRAGIARVPRELKPLIDFLNKKNEIWCVVDFGGGGGDNYLRIGNFLISKNDPYYCVDNSYLVGFGTQLFEDLNEGSFLVNKIYFVENLDYVPKHENYMLILIGVLQYLPSIDEFLSSLNFKPQAVFIARTAFVIGDGTILEQVSTFQPGDIQLKTNYRTYNFNSLIQMLKSMGYDLFDRSKSYKGNVNFSENTEHTYAGLLFILKK
jgi:putative methyltransferase (TIGR04325 family)